MNLVMIIALTVLSHVGGAKPASANQARRFRDVVDAVNFLHDNLPAQSTLDEKCKKYAVVSSIALSEKVPHRQSILNAMSLDENQLDKEYRAINIDRKIHVYLTTIDRYRIVGLAPAFIDIIECLRKIDTPAINIYLNHQELVIVLDLYKQVLGLPGTQIDPKSLHPNQFSPAFWESLKNLFERYFQIFGQASSLDDDTNYASSQSLDDSISRRQRHLRQRRERSRLFSLRQRMMDPEGVRNYQNERTRLAKGKEREILSQASDTPEVVRMKMRIQERRNRSNLMRRLRRQRRREQQSQQQLEAIINPPNLAQDVGREQQQTLSDNHLQPGGSEVLTKQVPFEHPGPSYDSEDTQ